MEAHTTEIGPHAILEIGTFAGGQRPATAPHTFDLRLETGGDGLPILAVILGLAPHGRNRSGLYEFLILLPAGSGGGGGCGHTQHALGGLFGLLLVLVVRFAHGEFGLYGGRSGGGGLSLQGSDHTLDVLVPLCLADALDRLLLLRGLHVPQNIYLGFKRAVEERGLKIG
jgi:hypothetical protein